MGKMNPKQAFSICFLALVCIVLMGIIHNQQTRIQTRHNAKTIDDEESQRKISTGGILRVAPIARKNSSTSSLVVPTFAPVKPTPPLKKGRKVIWIMGVGSTGKQIADQYYAFVMAAINSAKVNAPSLVPHLVYSGEKSALPAKLVAIPGITYINHNLTFMDQLIKFGHNANAFGAFYRIDIPIIMNKIKPLVNPEEVDPSYVLYTDTDVLFFGDFHEFTLPKPKVMYIGPESIKGAVHNSGVLYINTTAFSEHLKPLMQLAVSKQWQFKACDQGLIMQYFRDQNLYTRLPDEYNWKGYWGGDVNNVSIAHFHAAKPGRCLDCFLMYRQHIEVCNCKAYETFFRSAPDQGAFYEHMLINFRNHSKLSLVPVY